MGPKLDTGTKKDTSIDANQPESQLDKATMPSAAREQVRPKYDDTKGAVLLNRGVRDRSQDAGRDALLDPMRQNDPAMMKMISTVVFPELQGPQTPQSQAFLKAFENPALIRSYLINPQETTANLAARFPDMQEMLLKNMPFQIAGDRLVVNPLSGMYAYAKDVANSKDNVLKERGAYNAMDSLLSSPFGAIVGGSSGMETKAIELIDNHIRNQGNFNKEGIRLQADIGRLMQSPQAQQDIKEARALAAQGPITFAAPGVPPQGGGAIPAPTSGAVPPPSMKGPPSGANPAYTVVGFATPPPASTPGQGTLTGPGRNNTIPGTTPAPATPTPPPAGVTPSGPTPAAPAPAATPPAPGAVNSTTPTPPPAGVTPSGPIPAPPAPAATPPAPGVVPPPPAPSTPAPNNEISAREKMLQDQIAALQAQVDKQAATPATPAPSEEVKQLQQQNKEMNERLAKIEKVLEQTVQKNAELEKKLAEAEKKNAELLKKNEELEKKLGAKPNTPPDQTKKDLSQEEVIGKAKALYGAMSGPGTDEATVFKTLASLDKAGQEKVAEFYKNTYGETLDDALKGDLNATELALAMKLREGTSPGTADAVQIYVATAGYGKAEDSGALKMIMKDKSRDEISGIASRYQQLIGSPLEKDLKSWFSEVPTEQEAVLEKLKGRTYDLHELIDSGKAMSKDGLPKFKELMDDPNTIEEYERWYGKKPAEELQNDPRVQAAIKRRDAARKAIEETDFLDDILPQTPE